MKIKDKLLIGGAVALDLIISGCADNVVPEYSVPETKIKDNYSKTNSYHVVRELKDNIRNINSEYSDIDDKTKNENWHEVINQELEAIDKATSLAVRSVVEKEKHDYEYPASDDKRKVYLDTRLNALLYNQNTAINNVLDSLKIDPMLQTVLKNDSISIGDYIDSRDEFLEYRIHFLDGGERKETDNGRLYFDSRKILFSIYNWDKNALGVYDQSRAKPQLEFSKELELDFANKDYTFRDVLKLASQK